MKKIPIYSFRVALAFLIAAASLGMTSLAGAASARTYIVLVGAENVKQATGVMAYFPESLSIHVGDTVVWRQNTYEIHTVTFLAGNPEPVFIVPVPPPPPTLPGPVMLNPLAAFPVVPSGGLYDGTTYANSGIMSTDPGNPTQFSLTFTQAGTFTYECLVHGMMMSGTIQVKGPSANIPSPAAVLFHAKKTMTRMLAHANGLLGEAMRQVPPPVHNADGTTAHTVLVGWSKGQLDLMRFLPSRLKVRPGDTVVFMLSSTNDAPHTVTFLNGGPDISFVVPVPNPPGPPILLINPQVLAPINPGQPLTHTGVFSSGLLQPGIGPTSFSFKIGDVRGKLAYLCLLHDTSGMVGQLVVDR